MALNAQQLITMSIGKITGSRSQRGGINLRKNLLVASVLHTARAYYYEEMCNRMEGNISLEVTAEHEDNNTSSNSTDWENSNSEISTENQTEESTCDQELPRVAVSCERCLGEGTADKENDSPMEFSKEVDSKIDNETEDRLHEPSPVERNVLTDRTYYENNSKMAVITVTVDCSDSGKRKRSETEEACENILPKKARTETTSENTYIELKSENSSSITSLVSIFRSSLHGLSGGEGDNSNSFNSQSQRTASNNNHLVQQPAYAAPITRPFDSISTPIAAC